LREQITDILPDGAYLVTGGLRRETLVKATDIRPGEERAVPAEEVTPEAERPWQSFNSVFVISPEGDVEDFYDKHHLVPFGEYLPQQQLLEFLGLEQLTRLRGGFTAGEEPRTLALGKLGKSFSPLICYEVIFPGRVVGDFRPDFLITVTNDGWFGKSAGPWQHLEMARMRTIEEGLPIIRSANTGVSAVFDALGRQHALMPLMQRGVLDVSLPPAVDETPYARYGDMIFFLMFFGVAGLVYRARRASA
jgi:apolipoprotein N-acyltransferase